MKSFRDDEMTREASRSCIQAQDCKGICKRIMVRMKKEFPVATQERAKVELKLRLSDKIR